MNEARSPRAEQWLERLGADIVPLSDANVERERRSRTVARIDAALARSTRRRPRRWYVLAAAAGLLLMGGAVLAMFRSTAGVAVARVESARGDVLVTRAGESIEVRAQAPVIAEDGVRTTAGSAVIVLRSQARLELAERTSVRWPGSGQGEHEELWLERGRVKLSVPKLGARRRLVVSTPDSRVVVKGTRFSVAYSSDPARTEVQVEEGVVAVSSFGRDVTLRAGERWSSAGSATPSGAGVPAAAPVAPPSAPAAPAPAPAESAAAVPAPARSVVAVSPPASVGQEAKTTLAEENRLYQSAMSALGSGRDALGLQQLDELLARYPRSPLNESAQVERFRALARLGNHSAAAQAARRYLASYPRGFASAEARRISLGDAGRP